MPRIKIGGKFNFNKLPKDLQEKVKNQVKANEKNGLKINGKPATREYLKELEVQAKPKAKKISKKKK